VRQATLSPETAAWPEALRTKLNARKQAGVYRTVSRSAATVRVLPSKILLKVKSDPPAFIEDCRALSVARGFMQVEGMDHTNTFAPVAEFQSM
jgi:hypothetical protein